MAWYRTRNAAFGTVNVEALCSTDMSRGTVGPFVVPDGANSIQEINVSIGDSTRVATACGGTATLHLTGGGLRDGEQFFPVIGYGNLDLSNTGKCFVNARIKLPHKLAVIPGMEITAKLSQTGADWGVPEGCVGLTFSEAAVPEKYINVVRNGAMNTAVATLASIGTTWNAATVGALNLVGYKRITKFITVAGNSVPLSSASGAVYDVVLRGTCLGASSDMRIPCGAASVLDTTTGDSHGYLRPVILNTDVPLQSGVLLIECYQNGVDTGVPNAAVGLELEV